jgi:hypothetical protein
VYFGPFDAFDRRSQPGVHRHTFDYASGLEPDSETIGIVVEVQGMQHITSEFRKQRDSFKVAWARAFSERVYFYQIKTWTKERIGNKIRYNKCSITDYDARIKYVLEDIQSRAAKDRVRLPLSP